MSTVAFATEVARVRRVGGLSDAQIAGATGAGPSTVRDWFAGRSAPSGLRAARVAELAEIVDRLARVMDREYIPVWLLKPIEGLDDRTPLAVIGAGRGQRVARLISGLESPGAA